MPEGCIAVIVSDGDFFDGERGAKAGHICYVVDAPDGNIVGLNFGCPCGCGRVYGATFKPHKPTGGWDWNGDREKPTLTPSLGCYEDRGSAYHWHGYLTAGVFTAC